jgi:hypothetical protein
MDNSSALGREHGTDRWGTLLDPYHYVREAEFALLRGDRHDAVTAITLAYLVFDVISPGCE